MWLLTTGPVVGTPMILAERPKERTAGVSSRSITLTSKVQFFDIFRGFFSGLRLAVGRHYRRRTP